MIKFRTYPGSFPVLETERMVLNALLPSDTIQIVSIAGAKSVADNTLSIPHPYTLGDAKTWLKKIEIGFLESAFYSFAIRNKGVLVGAIGLHPVAAHNHAELGYFIGENYRGNGYATEAAKGIMDFGFRELKLHRIFASHFAENIASGKVLSKAGMQREGLFPGHVLKNGRYLDIVQYGIINPY